MTADELSTRVDAVFFDCDGVLLDSVHVKEREFRAMMEERIPHLADSAMDYYWRNGGTSRLAKFQWIWSNLVGLPLSDQEIEALGREFAERVFQGVVKCPMVAGAQEFLDEFSTRVPCFLISGTPDAELKRVVEAREISRHFRDVCGSPRSKTEIGGSLLRHHRFEPSKVWFVGDATTDLEAARNLGTRFIGIDGPHLSPFVGPDVKLIADLRGLVQAMTAS